MRTKSPIETRTKLLDAARDIIRHKGFGATTIDEICAGAGVTKGGFFHHFASKEEVGIAAAKHFNEGAAEAFANAPYAALSDPRARLLGYVDFRAAMLDWEIYQYTCLLGTMVQEVHETHPDLRDACAHELADHVAMLTQDLAKAKAQYASDADWTPESVGFFMQSVLQGAFILVKAQRGATTARDTLAHLRRYLETLLPIAQRQ